MNSSKRDSLELVPTAGVRGPSDGADWLSQIRNRIENSGSGFDPRALVEDCANASKEGRGISRGLIFSSLKAAGFGPLLACEQLL